MATAAFVSKFSGALWPPPRPPFRALCGPDEQRPHLWPRQAAVIAPATLMKPLCSLAIGPAHGTSQFNRPALPTPNQQLLFPLLWPLLLSFWSISCMPPSWSQSGSTLCVWFCSPICRTSATQLESGVGACVCTLQLIPELWAPIPCDVLAAAPCLLLRHCLPMQCTSSRCLHSSHCRGPNLAASNTVTECRISGLAVSCLHSVFGS